MIYLFEIVYLMIQIKIYLPIIKLCLWYEIFYHAAITVLYVISNNLGNLLWKTVLIYIIEVK